VTAAQACDLMTIGHSNLPADRFITLLRDSEVSAVIDVRSVPFSRWCPWFSSKPLATGLAAEGLAYLQLGDELGGRPRDPQLYCDGIADYEAMARRPEFCAGLDRVIDETRRHRVCLLCSEREPLDCHRCLLVGRALAERGVTPGHIHADGTHRAACGDGATAAQTCRRRSRSFWRSCRTSCRCLPATRPSGGRAAEGMNLL